MLRFAIRRTAAALLTLLGVLALVFTLLEAAPGDPAALAARSGGMRGGAVSSEALRSFRAAYGLDRPAPVRFVLWVRNALTLDFGRSLLDGRDVTERIAETLPTTLGLNAAALLLAVGLSLVSGIAAARRPDGAFDRVSGLVGDALFALPAFVLGLVLLMVFSVSLRWIPLFPDGATALVLPVATLALSSLAFLTRFVRRCLLAALGAPCSTAARARGAGEREVILRALRRSAIPFAAMGAALVPGVVTGSVLVERLFAIPGSGRLLADAVSARDVPTVLALTALAGVLVVVASLAADLVAAVIDPRIREAAGPDAPVPA